MIKSLKKSPLVGLVAVLATSLAFVVPSIASAEDQGQSREQSRGQAQSREDGNQAPQVRLGNPSKTISSDNDQADYDRQDGGIAGVTALGSRVFEARVANAAAPKVVATTPNLTRHGGNAMSVTNIYSIYWGSSFPTSGYAASVDRFLTDIGSSGYNSVTTQYMPTATPNFMTFKGSFSDAGTPPASSPTTASILAEVYKVVTAAGKTIDPQGLYMVFTNNFPSKANFCAWHGAGSVNRSATFTIAYQPYLGTMAGCSAATYLAGFKSKTSPAVPAVESVANVASHEIYETVTDPLLNAWYDSTGAEIGDKCAWKNATTVAGYSVQTEWDNSITGCKP
jgi:hypothetical protein